MWTYIPECRPPAQSDVEALHKRAYDHNVMRIQKFLQHDWYPETTKYTYHGKMLTQMVVDYTDWIEVGHIDEMHFFNIATRLAIINFNGEVFTYIQNLLGGYRWSS